MPCKALAAAKHRSLKVSINSLQRRRLTSRPVNLPSEDLSQNIRSLGVSAAALSLRLSQDSALCRQSHTCSALSQRMSTVRLPKETTTTFGVQHASQVPV